MDALRAEIANKRKALDAPSAVAQPAQKYMRKGDLQRLQQEREREEVAAAQAALAASSAKQEELLRVSTPTLKDGAPSPSSEPNRSGTGTPIPSTSDPSSAFILSDSETARRLRGKGQPIRLFGETPRDARLRLRALELIEERGGERHGGQNDFKRALEEVESRERERKAQDAPAAAESAESGKASAGKKKGGKDDTAVSGAGSEVLDLGMLKTEEGRSKLYPVIYHALKRILKEWEEAMNARPESVKRTTQGMKAAAMQNQSADYLKPLFKNLRSKNMPDDVLGRIAEIVHHTQKREYQKANDAYLRLSIGNAPWPIGVTMVGIHERSAREKISADQVAHVLNDEVSRKYIQSLKRLITFSQTAHPPEDSSQLMG